jgi:hypothetical protein
VNRVITIFAVTLMLPLALIGAERVSVGQLPTDVMVTVVESTEDHTVVRFEVSGFTREAVEIGGQEYVALSCGKEGVLLKAGEPAVPRLCRSVIIPDDAEMELRVLGMEYRDFGSTRVVPSKGNLLRTVNPAEVPYSFGPVYEGDAWYPAELTALREPYILRDFRGVVVEVNAFRYHPGLEVLRVYTSVTVEVRRQGPGRVNVLDRAEPLTHVAPEFDLLYERHFLNYRDLPLRYTPVMEVGQMLIITYDAFHAAMEPFVAWKVQKGIATTLRDISTIGNTSGAIRDTIQAMYDATGGDLAWVLLVGDAAQVATPTASGGSADPTYAKVAGSDDYPDLFVGRFSAQTVADVETQVERTVEYERDAQAGADWYHMGTGIASNLGPGHHGEYDNEHMNLIRGDLLAFTYSSVDQIYDPGATASQVTTALNTGRSIVNYCGHGTSTSWSTTGFSSWNVNALSNDDMLPFIISVACVNGRFATGTCFAEAWLRATHNGNPSGALATYMSSINQTWNPPMDAQDEAVDLLCSTQKTTFGGICYNGSCRMIDINGSGGVALFNTWHIFGDPSVQVRTTTPEPMSVTHEGEIPLGRTTFDVTVDGMRRVLCALAYQGTLLGSAYTGIDGTAVIPIEGELPVGEYITLTVTTFNKLTYIADILVVASGSPIEDLRAQVEGSNLVLFWSPTGAVEYNVYSDSDPSGSFTNLEGTVSDTSFSLPTSSEKLFFIVKSSDGN